MLQHYFVKLIPPRPTFAQDMTEDERALMQRHGAYWAELIRKGKALLFGPVLDPNGAFGICVLGTEDEREARALVDADPVRQLVRFEVHPMRAVVLGNTVSSE